MNIARRLFAVVALLLAAGSAAAQVRAGEWLSYRDAYRAMVQFEKYGKSKNLIQNHYQVMPKDRTVPTDGLVLTLSSKSMQLNLPLDATGRAVFPLLKAAYDDNAALLLNHSVGQYVFRPRVSILARPDGVYEVQDLRAACEQALNYQRFIDASLRAKKCVGVRFAFARKGVEAGVKVRKGESGKGESEQALPVADGAAFPDDPNEGFRTVSYRFAVADAAVQLHTQDAPLAIAALYE